MDTSTQPWAIQRVGQIAINVHDVGSATSFYRDVLGMKFLFAAPPGLAFFDCGGTRLMLTTPESPEHDHRSSVIYYVVPNIADAYRALSERGVSFEDKPHVVARLEKVEIWMTFLKDPDGNLLALMCEVSV
ncbi:MAG TPA: VOC family protein [Gemmatimonadaceae bacterium]|nr:VOC family protein [Gemmatimonadaceae bacterium]